MANAIRQLRVSRGWTQSELGKRAGVVQQKISLFERGLKVRPAEIKKILKAFELVEDRE